MNLENDSTIKEERDQLSSLVSPTENKSSFPSKKHTRRLSEYGRFLTPGDSGLQRHDNDGDDGHLNSASVYDESDVETEKVKEITDVTEELEQTEDGKKSPSQGVPRRRAVDTSDLRSCALVQSKLKTHRCSWKSIDGTPL